MTPFDTTSMTAGMGITDSAAIKMRSAMNKQKGWNMLASHRQVKKDTSISTSIWKRGMVISSAHVVQK